MTWSQTRYCKRKERSTVSNVIERLRRKNWKLTIGFGKMKNDTDLNKSNLSREVLTKAWLEWAKERWQIRKWRQQAEASFRGVVPKQRAEKWDLGSRDTMLKKDFLQKAFLRVFVMKMMSRKGGKSRTYKQSYKSIRKRQFNTKMVK